MPPPPNSVLGQFDLSALLDSTDTAVSYTAGSACEPPAASLAVSGLEGHHLAGQTASSSLMQSEDVPASQYSIDWPALQTAVQQDPEAGLHSQLYHLLAQCQPDVSDQMTDEIMLQQKGHDQILTYLHITRCDLCYHPKRYESWERVLSKLLLFVHAILQACQSTGVLCIRAQIDIADCKWSC